MKNTESIGWLYDLFIFSPDYARGMKQKLKTRGYEKLFLLFSYRVLS
jgi:hypothetical protein